MSSSNERTIGLFGATLIGVGAIVGGGILALAGVAFNSAGPGAMVAFLLNGGIALLTAFSFAELSAMFPQSGGTYTFAKRVLSVRAAFTLGWIVWFASIVAGVLYALGFAQYAIIVLQELWLLRSDAVPAWLSGRAITLLLAMLATAFYTLSLTRSSGSGGNWATIAKVIAFGILITGGLIIFVGEPSREVTSKLEPFFMNGFMGIFTAMGFTFIALQGFDLIAAAAGEIKTPAKTIPRAMFASLLIALLVYLPLLFVIATVGVPDGSNITALSAEHTETVIAVAAQQFLGPAGFWLVVVAALLSMLSALQANLFAASRIALSMARDRTLPRRLGRVQSASGIPVNAVVASAGMFIIILLLLPDLASAGAAASLIFLVTFTLTHWISYIARTRATQKPLAFTTPFFPLIQLAGGVACAVLAIFQGIVVPSAGLITLIWIVLGISIYLYFFSARARSVDALAEAKDPYLIQLRGRSPLVLVPIANPANAEAMVTLANAISPPKVGRVLLLSIVTSPDNAQLANTQRVLTQSLQAAYNVDLFPEALTTTATDPWAEISRVADSYNCEGLLLGLSDLSQADTLGHVNQLMSRVKSDIIILRAPKNWTLSTVQHILVPIGGKSAQDSLRSRLLGSISRNHTYQTTYLRVVPTSTTDASLKRITRALQHLAEDENSSAVVVVARSDDALAEILVRSAQHDLMILGVERLGRHKKKFGVFVRSIAAQSHCALLLMSRRG